MPNPLASTPAIPVVCAVIEDGAGRVLIAQRPAHKHLALKWEFPGGKVESDEQPESALARELREELACEVAISSPLPRFRHAYETVVIDMIPFVCRLRPGCAQPHPHEHVAVRWVTPAELDKVDLAAADWPVVVSYREAIARTSSPLNTRSRSHSRNRSPGLSG